MPITLKVLETTEKAAGENGVLGGQARAGHGHAVLGLGARRRGAEADPGGRIEPASRCIGIRCMYPSRKGRSGKLLPTKTDLKEASQQGPI